MQLRLHNVLGWGRTGGGYTKFADVAAPDDTFDPTKDNANSISQVYARRGINLSLRDGAVIHYTEPDKGIFYDSVRDYDLDIGPYLQRSVDGHIEFVHP